MTDTPCVPPSIQRSFRDLSDAEVADIERASLLARAGWSGSFGWDELLRSQRILIVSEAGAGKTYECRSQQERLWNAGEPAFFLDLATLATSSVRDMLSGQEEQRLDEWLRSQSEVATFFLDSIDELKLTLGKFDQALKRLNKSLAGQLGRVRVVISLLVGKRFLAASLLQSDFAGEVFGYGGITIGPADHRMLISCDRPTARSRHDAGPLRKKTAYAPPCRAQTWTSIGLIGNRQVTDSHIEISSSLRPLVSTAAIATVAPPTTPIAARNK
jgi:hypothetical protein